MKQRERTLTAANVTPIKAAFCADLATIGETIKGKSGIALLTALKRDKLGHGPYPDVSLFEAANRIMSDLVRLCRNKLTGDNRAMVPLHVQLTNSTLRRVVKRLHFPLGEWPWAIQAPGHKW